MPPGLVLDHEHRVQLGVERAGRRASSRRCRCRRAARWPCSPRRSARRPARRASSSSTSICQSSSRNRLRVPRSRARRAAPGAETAAAPRKNVSGCPRRAPRGRGAIMSIQRAVAVLDAPRVRHADGHDAAGARAELDAAAVEVEGRRTLEDVEALLEGVQVAFDVAVLEPAQARGPCAPSRWSEPTSAARRTRRCSTHTRGARAMSSRDSGGALGLLVVTASSSRRRPRDWPRSSPDSRAGTPMRRPCLRQDVAPVGVRARTFRAPPPSRSSTPCRATIPGWRAFTRTGASSSASVRIERRQTAPFDGRDGGRAGYGRSFASPPKTRIDASGARRRRAGARPPCTRPA